MTQPSTSAAASGRTPNLLPDAAFVLQLERPGDAVDRSLRGRVEHIATGAWTYFDTLDELMAFVDSLRFPRETGA